MNKNLGCKDYEGRDEYYTTRETAEGLLCCAKPEHFAGKVIYCNCDGLESEIYKLLKERYAYYGLKKLVATKFIKDGHGIKATFDGRDEAVEFLDGDGKYQSPECESILRECDIVVTNPPFSQLGEYIPFVIEHNKDLVVIVNLMAMMYKKIFPYAFRGDFYFISRFSGGGKFKRPNGDIACVNVVGITTIRGLGTEFKYMWHMYATQQLKDKGKLAYVDNTSILECKYCADIPIDYDGIIYVPSSVLLNARIRKYFDVVRFVKEPVVVDGKQRFYRIAIKKKAGISAEQILRENNGGKL